MLSDISDIVKIAPDDKDSPYGSRILTRKHLTSCVFLYTAFTVSSIALSLHGSPVCRPREFLFPNWSGTVKLLSYLSSLWVAPAEQIGLLLCSKNILLFLIIQYMIVYVKEHFN